MEHICYDEVSCYRDEQNGKNSLDPPGIKFSKSEGAFLVFFQNYRSNQIA